MDLAGNARSRFGVIKIHCPLTIIVATLDCLPTGTHFNFSLQSSSVVTAFVELDRCIPRIAQVEDLVSRSFVKPVDVQVA